jgi:hypothetical protein
LGVGWAALGREISGVAEGEAGFFVQHQGADEAVGATGAGDVDGDGEHAGDAALEVRHIGRRG